MADPNHIMKRLAAKKILAAAIITGMTVAGNSCVKKSSSSDSGDDEAAVSSGIQPESTQEYAGGGAAGLVVEQKYVRMAVDQIRPEHFKSSNSDLDSVTSALEFPGAISISPEGEEPRTISLEWKVSQPAIDAHGSVTRPPFGSGDSVGSVQVVARSGPAVAYRTFPVAVLQIDPTDAEAVLAMKAELSEEYVKLANTSLNSVTTNLRMPVAMKHGVAVSWGSTISSVAVNGTVSRPAYHVLPSNPSGTLTATLTKGIASATRTLNIRVIRQLPPLMITEVSTSSVSTEGYVEITNTTSSPINLGDYVFWSCDSQPLCASKETQPLPTQDLAAGAHLIIRPRVGGDTTPNSATDIFIDSLLLFYQTDYFEVARDGATIDFVKWRFADGNPANPNPLAGSFTGVVGGSSATGTSAVGRVFPYEDSDGVSEWAVFSVKTPRMTNGTGTAPGTDSDGDGLTDEMEVAQSFTNPYVPDTDSDGFSDGQEWLSSGVGGLNIKALGAHPLVRDIFVELDYMALPAGAGDNRSDTTANNAALRPRREALEKVAALFANFAPQPDDVNPFPIKLHIDAGSLFDPAEGINIANFDLGGGSEVPFSRCLYLGTDSLRNGSNCVNLYDLKQIHFSPSRQYVFHYMVMGWSMEVDGSTGNSGLAEIPGNDAILTIGSWGNLPEQMIVNWQAATILHELGHNLGLDHGGNQSANYKPNYVSTMNYLYQLNGLDTDRNGDIWYFEMGSDHPRYSETIDVPQYTEGFQIGFSRGNAVSLVESALNEVLGIGGIPIDFNGNNQIDSGTVSANAQPAYYNSTATGIHQDFDDWGNLNLKFQGVFSLGGSVLDSGEWSLLDDSVTSDQQPVGPECQEPAFRKRLPIPGQ